MLTIQSLVGEGFEDISSLFAVPFLDGNVLLPLPFRALDLSGQVFLAGDGLELVVVDVKGCAV